MAAEATTAAPHGARSLLARAARGFGTGAARLRGERVLPGAALLAAIALVLVETPLTAAPHLPLPVAFAVVIVHAGALPAAFRIPNVAASFSFAAALVLQWLTADTASVLWPWSPVLIITQCLVLGAVAARTTLPVALLHWLIAVVGSASLSALLRPRSGNETAVDVAVFGSISVALIVVAIVLTQWQQVRNQLLHERLIALEEAARLLVIEERSRIARELHDVVAHSLSIITVQSSTARFRHRDFSEEAGEEFDRIAAQSRQALDEMRGLLRVMRGSDEDADRKPQPGLRDIAVLVAQARASGARIELDEPAGDWSAGIGALPALAAFRIVQEAISNAIRHAPGSEVRVEVDRRASNVIVRVANSAPPDVVQPQPERGAGHGLVGMRERASTLGGSVEVGTTDDGGFAVRAVLPIHAGIGEVTA
jgi:signal transduction histidine kinase